MIKNGTDNGTAWHPEGGFDGYEHDEQISEYPNFSSTFLTLLKQRSNFHGEKECCFQCLQGNVLTPAWILCGNVRLDTDKNCIQQSDHACSVIEMLTTLSVF